MMFKMQHIVIIKMGIIAIKIMVSIAIMKQEVIALLIKMEQIFN